MAEKGGGGGDVEPATRAAGGMCDRFLTFLAKNLSVSRMKGIADGPGSGGGQTPPTEGGAGDHEHGVDGDEFAIPIERAEFDFQLSGHHGDGGHSSGSVAPTILEESAAATTTRDVPDDEQKDGAAAATTAADGPAAPPAVPAVEETTTKVRRTVTIKEDRPAQDGGASATATATVERKKSSLFRKRSASSAGAGEEQGGAARVPKRSGLRPRMPQVPRVPSNINEQSSTFIEERKKSFFSGGKPVPEK